MSAGTFAEWAPRYRELGYWPRPIQLGSKACKLPGWQRPDNEIDNAILDSWIDQNGHHGIGLLLGSPFPDGSQLGALDIDDGRFIRVAEELLDHPPSGRIGERGIMLFVRLLGDLSMQKFEIQAKSGDPTTVGEFLVTKHLAVIPPTVHPKTQKPYRWIGRPLHEVDFEDLPLVRI